MYDVINYNVDDYGVLRVYCGNVILGESEGWGGRSDEDIEKFIEEEYGQENN